MGSKSQRKGRSGEKELAGVLQEHGYGATVGKALNFGGEPDVSGIPGVHIECKRNEHLNLWEAMEQARVDSEKFKDGLPAVFHRKNHQGWLVTMRLEDWLTLYEME